VGLVHTQKIEAQSEKPTWTKALEFTQFACPCGTARLLSGEQRTSHFKLVTSVDGPEAVMPHAPTNVSNREVLTRERVIICGWSDHARITNALTKALRGRAGGEGGGGPGR
jgi:hypothetical protein